MEVFNFTPYGDVSITYQWDSKAMSFEDYTKQYYRRRVHAKKTYAFTIGGLQLAELVKFYNRHKGLQEPFYFAYDGVMEVCYFSQAINPRCKRENGVIKAYSCEVVLEVDRQVTSYPTAQETDVLPNPHGETDQVFDWHTQLVTAGQRTERMARQTKPTRTITGKWSGLKSERDTLIRLFNSHCRVPLTFRYNGEDLKVVFPDKIEIKDKRELRNIIGYECQMELEVID
ncbi:hypothetical protein [Selenomonas ruminantium]|uniref:Uncharacterized protein n=1 Tax=Selenomonas ruminantium TaxID=971 RepID=A0A1I0YDR3_SELRU|nr:hypothetical protein [Selenomonas ruminantium]SFB10927.1 hypothetical protein SAMN05216587_111111 [Selenomonas ruminantium]